MNPRNRHSERPDLICLSHLRWKFVFQRPQHLMSRFARERRVYFVEEPIFETLPSAELRREICPRSGVCVLTPHLPEESRSASNRIVAALLRAFLRQERIRNYIAWFYTPMALDFSVKCLAPKVVVYDCMDELSLFRGAPPELCANENKLLRMADLVFTGGVSLFEAKRSRHSHVYAFPSGVDVAHFGQARSLMTPEESQQEIPHPRLGYAGVIDERLDLALLREVAQRRPEWQLIMVGPVVKIDPSTLPREANIHWLGMKSYDSLPKFFAGWDVAMMPFALNDATRFISPTKTPEYLAAGLPVVSTGIRDVIKPYGELGLARIAYNPDEFVSAVEQALMYGMSLKWRERADAFLETLSWEDTWSAMNSLINNLLEPRASRKGMAAASVSGVKISRREAAGV